MSTRNRGCKRRSLFSPDEIATQISQALGRDFSSSYVQSLGHPATEMWLSSQLKHILKKYVSETPDTERLEQLTFEKFLKINAHMKDQVGRVNYPFHLLEKAGPGSIIQSHMHYEDKILLRARALMHFVLGDLGQEEWFLECRHSQGASLQVPYSDTSLERKWTFPLTATERVKPLFVEYLTFDHQLKAAVEEFNRDHPVTDACTLVRASRASTVEKDDQVRRMICVEPTLNMFFQQGLMQVMYKRMKAVGLDVETLPMHHQQLARESSISSKFATIDFSSASDCVSIELLEWLLPPRWFAVVDQTRCEFTTLNGQELRLNMIATMGNAVTFPLETLVFWTLAHAVRLTANDKSNTLFPEWEDLKCCSVFGDDCIVPTELAVSFMEMAERVGFIVNKEKSYYDASKFRESCGGDYLAGYAVRPYYLRAPTSRRRSSLEPWLYVIFNSILKKYILYFGRLRYLYVSEVFSLIFALLEEHGFKVKLVPDYYPDDAGLKISDDLVRWCNHYRFSLSDIVVNRHGTVSFKFLRFQYRFKKATDDRIRYVTWLKTRSQRGAASSGVWLARDSLRLRVPEGPISQVKFRSLRRIGGYVEAKGLTSHWDVPRIDFLS